MTAAVMVMLRGLPLCAFKQNTGQNDTLLVMWKAKCRQEKQEISGIVVVEILVKM